MTTLKFEINKPVHLKLQYDFPFLSDKNNWGGYSIAIVGETADGNEACAYSSCKGEDKECHNCSLFANDCISLARQVRETGAGKGDTVLIVKREDSARDLRYFEVSKLSK